MEITLAKLTPYPKSSDKTSEKGWADFDITYKEFSFKIKGCYIIYIRKKDFYIVNLPISKTHQGEPYTLICFNGIDLAKSFFAKSQEALSTTYPYKRWKEGKYSKFNQGLKKKK